MVELPAVAKVLIPLVARMPVGFGELPLPFSAALSIALAI